jgi:F-type H+-transporting ATPase subunit a
MCVSYFPVLAEDHLPWPPSVEEFYPPGVGGLPYITKITVLLWGGVAFVILAFLIAYRRPKIVPTRIQWFAESIYGFAREGARDMMGAEDGVRFAPYLATLFSFVLITNIWGIIPFAQLSPNSHIAFPAFLAIISWVTFLYLGIRKHGLLGYLKMISVPPGTPWYMLWLVAPIEFFSTVLVRPVTLAVRLFANMFAGHLILAVFTIGGFALLGSSVVFLKPVSILSWLLAIVLTLFEFVIAALQAYVFLLLTTFYFSESLAEGH